MYFNHHVSLYPHWCKFVDRVYNWRGEYKTMLSDDLGEKKNCREKAWILACWLRFFRETLLWSVFRLAARSFREITYAKNLAFPGHVFVFTCLLNRKQANCLQCTKLKSNPRAYRSGDLGTDFLHRLLWREHNARIDRASNELPSKIKEMWRVRALSTNILSIVLKYLV